MYQNKNLLLVYLHFGSITFNDFTASKRLPCIKHDSHKLPEYQIKVARCIKFNTQNDCSSYQPLKRIIYINLSDIL